MPTFAEKSYTFEPVCIYCGKQTQETLVLPSRNGRYFGGERVTVPGHKACANRRALLAYGSAMLYPLVAIYALQLLVRLVTLSPLVQLVGLLFGVVGGMYVMMILAQHWVNAPRDQFMREHSLERPRLR